MLFHTFETSSVRNPQSFNVKNDPEVFLSEESILWLQTGFHAAMFILVSVERLLRERFAVDGLRSPINSALNIQHPWEQMWKLQNINV